MPVRDPAVLIAVDGMIVSVLRHILFLIPGVLFQLCSVFRAGVYYQVTALLYPSKLQVNPVYDGDFLVAVIKIVKAAMKALVLAKLRDGRLVCVVYENIPGKAPVGTALFQKGNILYRCVGWR